MQVGVDTGGTFTDVVCRDDDGRLRVHKLLSTPDDPSRAIAGGVDVVRGDRTPDIVHGTTVATNALLERRGARVAFVTTAGFEDLLFLRRQNRPQLYAFDIRLPPPLVARERCLGVHERVRHDGSVQTALSDDELRRIVDELRKLAAGGVEAVAICLLHAYANPAHEARLAEAISAALPELHVSASHHVSREFREFERASTTSVNAFVGPVMSKYLTALRARTTHRKLEILQSSGGRTSAEHAALFPVHTVLSGPAGGVVGALAAAAELGIDRIISFDMGGTSTDVSLCEKGPAHTTEAVIDGLPIRVPVIDIFTVGAGGGSIAYRDPGGALRVGPKSAGADPGPAAYGRGGADATVTDAHVVLGRLRPDRFLGGEMRLDYEKAQRAVSDLAASFAMDARALARGILDVADASMVRAIKVVSLEKGHDPRDFCLVSFGGAGGLHACRLAEALEIERVLVPRHPGLLSAYGMLHADAERLYSRTLLAPLSDEALREGRDRLAEEAAAGSEAEQIFSADLRYEGQSFEINVALDEKSCAATLVQRFAQRHEALYGYRADERAVELVTMRLRVVEPSVHRVVVDDAGTPHVETSEAEIEFACGTRSAQVVDRRGLREGQTLRGPAVVTEYSGTTIVPPGWQATIARGHLLLERLVEDDAKESST